MNLHQFRFVQEAVRQNLNLTKTAEALFTSQPGVSKAILDLESELGVDIFTRHGKRLRHITEPGQEVLKSVEIIMREVNNLKRIGQEFSAQDVGTLSIATTHSQARYFLPGPIGRWREQFPKVRISLHQGAPDQVAQMVQEEVADVGLATESLMDVPGLVTLPCYEWQHVLVMPRGHALADLLQITLADLAQQPLVSYHPSFSGRTRVDRAFAAQKLHPQIVLEAIDADVIKTYVKLGLGVGILAEAAMQDEPADGDLISRPLGHLLGSNVTRIAFKRGIYLRQFVFAFAHLLSDELSPERLELALRPSSEDAADDAEPA
jgi:LysR family transcriptional regulator, cys regulon transcriptional activator